MAPSQNHLSARRASGDDRRMAHAFWPLFDLRVRTPRLVLRVPTDDDLPALLDLVRSGIHDPEAMPFIQPWTDEDDPVRSWNSVRFWWRQRADVAEEKWQIALMATADGAPIGVQDFGAEKFKQLRTIGSGSWMAKARQGQGHGKEMRAAMLRLAFEGLGAEVALSEAFLDNPSSVGVSRALGYEDNGVGRALSREDPKFTQRFRLTRERFEELRAEGRYPDVEIENLEPCLPLLGLA